MEDAKETLLEKDYYENCSGCKVEQYKAAQRGLPVKQLFAIWIIVLATGTTSLLGLFGNLNFI